MEKCKVRYVFKYKEETDLQKQLDWSEKNLKELSICEFKIPMRKGEIYKYNKTIQKQCYFIVMGDSKEYDDNVLICPIYYDKGPDSYMPGINIGLIPELNLYRNFIASIAEIHFISKSKIVKHKDDGEAIFYGKLLKSVFMVILSSYRSLILKVLNDKSDYKEINSC